MKISRQLILGVLLTALFLPVHPNAYADNPIDKLSRGLSNMLTAVGEFGVHTTRQNKDNLPVVGMFRSILYGSYYTMGRLIAGVYETGTFLIPIPWKYKSVIQPETIA